MKKTTRSSRIAALTALMVIGAACSVSTPRNGFAGAYGSRTADGGIAGPTDDSLALGELGVAPDGSSSGGGSSGGGSSGGGTGTTVTGGTGGSASSGGDGSQQGGSTAVGVTDTSISISISMPFSSAQGKIFENLYNSGIVTWSEEVNAAGGIYGRKLVLKKVDNAGTADGAIAACKEALSNGTFLTYSIFGDEAEIDCLDAKGKIGFMATTANANPQWKHGRALSRILDAGTRVAEYLAGPLGGLGKKTGIIHTDQFFEAERVKSHLARAAAIGMDVVDVEKVAQNQGSFVSELSRMQSKGITHVAIYGQFEVLGILRDAKSINYNPTWTGTTWPVDEISAAGADLMIGIKALRLWVTTDTAAYKSFQEKFNRYGSGAATTSSMSFYARGTVLTQAFKAAGPNLTQAAMETAFERMGPHDSGMIPRVDFSSGRDYGSVGIVPVQCCNPDRTWKSAGPDQDSFYP